MGMLTPRLVVVTALTEIDLGGECSSVVIKNNLGSSDLYADFDNTTSSSVAPILAGESLGFDLASNKSRGFYKISLLSAGTSIVRIWATRRDEV